MNTTSPASAKAAVREPAPQRKALAESLDGPPVPRLPAAGPAMEGTQRAAALALLRRFCDGDAEAGSALRRPDGAWLPAALYPFRDRSAVRHDYPVFVPSDPDATPRCAPIAEHLASLADAISPDPPEARILRDNLVRLEREVRKAVEDSGTGVSDAREALLVASRALESSLGLKGESAKQLTTWLDKLVAASPEGGVLVPGSPGPDVHLLLTMATFASARRSETLRSAAGDLRRRIKDAIAAERAKGEAGQTGKALAGAVGSTDAGRLDSDALSRVLGKIKGGAQSDPTRSRRLEIVLETLTAFLEAPAAPLVHAVGHREDFGAPAGGPVSWHEPGAMACETACREFDRIASRLAPLFAAMRTARLELSGQFDAARHSGVAGGLDWRMFSQEELRAMPPVVAIETQENLAGGGMLALSRLLLSGRPIGVIVGVTAGAVTGAGSDPLGYRLELAYLGIGHREALVNQSSVSRPVHLADGYAGALNASHAALHVVDSGLDAQGRTPAIGAWLHGGAALEGRAHPLFHYDPERGKTWAKRLDFSMNPAPTEDWPSGEVVHESAAGVRSTSPRRFTFADFALLEEAFHDHYCIVPEGLESEALVGAAEFLGTGDAESQDLVPYIWGADGAGTLHRLAFSRRLAFACRDRLDYWRTLQELAGVRNEHVREAVQAERSRLEGLFEAERNKTAGAHAAEIERVRTEAAGEALRRLASALLDTDLGTLAPAAAPTAGGRAAPSTASPPTEATPKPEAPPAAAPAVEDAGFDEPWVDSALCTSCNDCTNINSKLFVYNANKQAVIGDPAAGTFADLVAAAEKCPARCIHPGKPSNPDEPGLAELIARAKPFN